jgi:uncharacterized protein (TIGR03067 family)
MRRIIYVLAFLALPQLLVADDEAQKEMKTLKGKWKAVGMEVAGNPVPKGEVMELTVVVGADGKSTGKMPQEEFRFTLSVNPKKSPKTFENVHESGDQQGKKQYGIYKLEGDKWTVCASPPGVQESDRPKDFNTKDTPNVVFVFERVKE